MESSITATTPIFTPGTSSASANVTLTRILRVAAAIDLVRLLGPNLGYGDSVHGR